MEVGSEHVQKTKGKAAKVGSEHAGHGAPDATALAADMFNKLFHRDQAKNKKKTTENTNQQVAKKRAEKQAKNKRIHKSGDDSADFW